MLKQHLAIFALPIIGWTSAFTIWQLNLETISLPRWIAGVAIVTACITIANSIQPPKP